MEEKVKKLIQDTVQKYPKLWKSGVCAYTAIDTLAGNLHEWVGSRQRGREGDVCHAPLNYIKNNEQLVIVNAHHDSWQKTSKDFLLWATRESPFASAILNRNNDDEILNHAAAIDVTQCGTGGTMWLCKAIRHFKEDTFKVKTWETLRAEGLDGLQAFIGADILDMEGEPCTTITHVSLFHYTDPASLRAFYEEIRKGGKRVGQARCGCPYDNPYKKSWGGLVNKAVKVSDGWGGFVEVKRPCEPREYAQKLKEIFEGDPKNVKES